MQTRFTNIDRIVLALMNSGAMAVPLLTKTEVGELVTEAKSLQFTPRNDAPSGVVQNFSAVDCFDGTSPFVRIAGVLSGILNRALEKHNLFPEPINFTDLSLQRYPISTPDCRYAISPHRDHQNSINLVAVIVLDGSAPFYVCDDRIGSNPQLISARIGEMILMRGHRFGEPRNRTFGRPFHYVGRVTQERLTFGLRQTEFGKEIPKY